MTASKLATMNLPAALQKSCFLLSLFPMVILEADTLQLNSGQQVNATVTKYANYSFEVRYR